MQRLELAQERSVVLVNHCRNVQERRSFAVHDAIDGRPTPAAADRHLHRVEAVGLPPAPSSSVARTMRCIPRSKILQQGREQAAQKVFRLGIAADQVSLPRGVRKPSGVGAPSRLWRAVCKEDGQVVVDESSIQYLDGTEVDFREDGLSSNFSFNNPNVEDECGCGESFTVS